MNTFEIKPWPTYGVYNTVDYYYTRWYICSAQFANLRNFEIALRKLEIAKLQTMFEIAQPSVRNLEIPQPSVLKFKIAQPSLRDFEIVLRKLETAKLSSAISKVDVYSNIKRIYTIP